MKNLEIAQKARFKPIIKIAESLGIQKRHLELYGDLKAKLSLDLLKKPGKPKSKYVVVTGITPTYLGEGKTVTTIGLSMALNRMGKKAVACIRQPSLGPFFGVKGGGVGGGRSQVGPGDDINLHLTGDIHAVGQAHNLCASFIDNHLFRGNVLNIDKNKISWRRVVDVNDRALRNVRIGLGGEKRNGIERDTAFDITAASEIMAILALSDSLKEMRDRLGKIVIGITKSGKPVTAEDLKVAGSMALLLKEAIKPSLVQTIEHTPCIIHTGPFANIMHGNSSVIADKIALKFADYVVTESGFGADCGLEKFANIKCRASSLKPDTVVLVCSVRALKVHSGIYKMDVGVPLEKKIMKENPEAAEAGCSNLEKQIENSRLYGIPCIVAINRFATDTNREINAVRNRALAAGAFNCVVSDCYRYGSRGAGELAQSVTEACSGKSKFRFLYPLDYSIKEKIETIAKRVYGAKSVYYEPVAAEKIALYEKLGFSKLPVCMAKTHLSISHDPKLKGAPKDFILPVTDIRPAIGAGFLSVVCGKMSTMPSLPTHPVGENIDIDAKGRIRYVHR